MTLTERNLPEPDTVFFTEVLHRDDWNVVALDPDVVWTIRTVEIPRAQAAEIFGQP